MASITVDLDEAERTGVISPGQAAVLRRSSNPAVHDEPIQVTNRFSEVFVAIGCAILLQGFHVLLLSQKVPPLYVALAQVAIAWGLAEVVRWRRMGFATGFCVLLMAWAAHHAAFAAMGGGAPSLPGPGYRGYVPSRPAIDLSVILAVAAAALAAGLARFRIPFLVLPTAATGAAALAFYLGAKGQLGSLPVLAIIGVAGACILGLGIWADRRDPERKGKASQYAFWLFVAGSPMTVHPFLILTLTQMKGIAPETVACAVIALSLAVTLLGLVIDRRGPVVSTLVYVTIAAGLILRSPGMATLLIGFYVVALGLLWKPVQQAVAGVIRRRVAPKGGTRPTGELTF